MTYKGKTYHYRSEVVCKDCGIHFQKDNYALKRWKGRCHPCARSETGRRFKGIKRSEQHRLRTGLASKGRKPSLVAIEKARKRFTGQSNPRWNPDREIVAKNERARRAMHSLIHGYLKRLAKVKTARSEPYLGYSARQLFDHLTSNFKPGMSWDHRSLWHIDHIKPIAQFIREWIDDPKVINALSNLRPVWVFENLSKKDNWTVTGK